MEITIVEWLAIALGIMALGLAIGFVAVSLKSFGKDIEITMLKWENGDLRKQLEEK